MENAPTGVGSVCSRCGLIISERASFTYWIFKENRCQCEMSDPGKGAADPGNGAPYPSKNSLEFSRGVSDPGRAVSPAGAGLPGGKQILNDRYELIERVGQGGVGYVYRGLDLTTGQQVALKVMRPELGKNQMAVKRVMREVEVVSGLSNSNLGKVYGYGVEKDGSPYLVMDFVEGRNLEEILKAEGKLKLERAVDIFMQICAGLICAHTNGIVHRDLKPSNVIVQQEKTGQDRVTIVDFGFARLLREANESLRLTQQGEVFGSPPYMSPEHCLGEEIDMRSDIYSLGCLMYEVLTGTPPLLGENVLSTVAKQVRGVPASMLVHDATIPESIDSIVLKCLSKEPQLRYQSVSDLRQGLDKIKRGEYIKASVKRAHTPAKTNKLATVEPSSFRSTESLYRKVLPGAGMVLLFAVVVGGGAGAIGWLVMQKQSSNHITSPSSAPSLRESRAETSGNPKAQTAAQSRDAATTTQPKDAATSLQSTDVSRNQSKVQSKDRPHKQIHVTSQLTVHHKSELHPVTRIAPASQHASEISHGAQAKPAKPSTSWEQLKGLRVYK